MTATDSHPIACPECGGPAATGVPWLAVRQCPGAVALLAGGQVITHMSAPESARLAGEMVLALASTDPGLLGAFAQAAWPEMAGAG